MITDNDVEKAVDWLRDQATPCAQAKANRIYLEEFRKVLKAQIMAEHNDMSIAAQEREAYSDPRYIQHLEAMRTAVEMDERNRFLCAAADAKISAWQTMNANQRMRV